MDYSLVFKSMTKLVTLVRKAEGCPHVFENANELLVIILLG